MGELPIFFLLSSREESHLNSRRFYFSFDAAICPEYIFQQLYHRPKIVTPKPSIIWGYINHRWKPGIVLFDFGIQLMVEFCIGQSWCHFSLLLLLI
jgi:hypothetical protein